MKVGLFRGIGYHGFGNPDAWEQACRDGLRVPYIPETDADFGTALYFTTSKKIASTYADKFNGRKMIVKAKISLPRAVFLKFSGQRERWEGKVRTPSLQWIDEMGVRYGDPSQWENRTEVANRWREVLLKIGIYGIVADNYDSPRTIAVFDPEVSIVSWGCS